MKSFKSYAQDAKDFFFKKQIQPIAQQMKGTMPTPKNWALVGYGPAKTLWKFLDGKWIFAGCEPVRKLKYFYKMQYVNTHRGVKGVPFKYGP